MRHRTAPTSTGRPPAVVGSNHRTTRSPRVHLRGDDNRATLCGRRSVARTTADPSAVTCQRCVEALNKDLAPLEESILVHRRAKQWARSRAVGRLVAAHREALNQLIAEELPAALAESIDLERRMERRMEALDNHQEAS